ncbi:MAG: hypothetical protein EOM87_01800, partial [Clostridia bacterium]|nr:hypothetical protein [Clostridia bacterium]
MICPKCKKENTIRQQSDDIFICTACGAKFMRRKPSEEGPVKADIAPAADKMQSESVPPDSKIPSSTAATKQPLPRQGTDHKEAKIVKGRGNTKVEAEVSPPKVFVPKSKRVAAENADTGQVSASAPPEAIKTIDQAVTVAGTEAPALENAPRESKEDKETEGKITSDSEEQIRSQEPAVPTATPDIPKDTPFAERASETAVDTGFDFGPQWTAKVFGNPGRTAVQANETEQQIASTIKAAAIPPAPEPPDADTSPSENAGIQAAKAIDENAEEDMAAVIKKNAEIAVQDANIGKAMSAEADPRSAESVAVESAEVEADLSSAVANNLSDEVKPKPKRSSAKPHFAGEKAVMLAGIAILIVVIAAAVLIPIFYTRVQPLWYNQIDLGESISSVTKVMGSEDEISMNNYYWYKGLNSVKAREYLING